MELAHETAFDELKVPDFIFDPTYKVTIPTSFESTFEYFKINNALNNLE